MIRAALLMTSTAACPSRLGCRAVSLGNTTRGSLTLASPVGQVHYVPRVRAQYAHNWQGLPSGVVNDPGTTTVRHTAR